MSGDHGRSAFAGGDQAYLRDDQYRDGGNLNIRARLHLEFGTASLSLAEFESALIEWPPDGDVLDCGCGTGIFWGSGAPPTSVRLTLTDLSPGMVEEARRRATMQRYPVVGARAADVQELPFDDASFDVVVANHMLYHVPDPAQAIAEFARVLRPDGVLLAATNAYGHMAELNEMVFEVFGDHGEALYEVFGMDSGERRLRESFGSIVWHSYVNDLVVDDPQAVVDYGLSFPPGEGADEGQRRRFADVVDDRFRDGPVRIRTRAGVFVCRRPRDVESSPPGVHRAG